MELCAYQLTIPPLSSTRMITDIFITDTLCGPRHLFPVFHIHPSILQAVDELIVDNDLMLLGCGDLDVSNPRPRRELQIR